MRSWFHYAFLFTTGVLLVLLTVRCGVDIPDVSATDRQTTLEQVSTTLDTYMPEEDALVRGATTYEQHCQGCHAEDGRGQIAGTTVDPDGLGSSANNDPLAFYEVTALGDAERNIPGFYDTLTKQELLELLAYTQTLPTE